VKVNVCFKEFRPRYFISVALFYFAVCVTRCVCEKITQNGSQAILCQNEYIALTVEKSSPHFLATFVISNTLSTVNNRDMGEN
jgi:hypothetical protein